MVERTPQRRPRRFRRRLTAAFILVAALSGGLVAVVTYLAAREYRWHNFRSTSTEEVRVALALSPATLDNTSFARLRAVYEARTQADLIAEQDGNTFVSSPTLRAEDVPVSLRRRQPLDRPTLMQTVVNGHRTMIVAANGGGGASYYFLFSLDELQASLSELAHVAGAAWMLTVLLAGTFGAAMARRTLRPVAATAEASESIAAGELSARLVVEGGDEFGVLGRSFNHMADEMQTVIGKLEAAAGRERRFTADVAHELRTPLTGMTATASVLRDQLDSLPEALRRPATVLVADVQRLRDLVADLLELSRLDAGTEDVALENLCLVEAVEAVKRASPAFQHAIVSADIPPDLAVMAEPRRLRQILTNVVNNAVVHAHGRVWIRAHRDGSSVVVDLVDDGPGIAEEDLARVFDRFFKSDRSRAGGSGLGLAIARKHALAEDGDLSAANEPGRGARFTLRLRAAGTAWMGDDGRTPGTPPEPEDLLSSG